MPRMTPVQYLARNLKPYINRDPIVTDIKNRPINATFEGLTGVWSHVIRRSMRELLIPATTPVGNSTYPEGTYYSLPKPSEKIKKNKLI